MFFYSSVLNLSITSHRPHESLGNKTPMEFSKRIDERNTGNAALSLSLLTGPKHRCQHRKVVLNEIF